MNCWYCQKETKPQTDFIHVRCVSCNVVYAQHSVFIHTCDRDKYLRLVPDENKCELYKKSGTTTYTFVYCLSYIPTIDSTNVKTIVDRLFNLVIFS